MRYTEITKSSKRAVRFPLGNRSDLLGHSVITGNRKTVWCYSKIYEECYTTSKDAIAKFPNTALLYGYAGDACRELKKYDEAFPYWEKHVELDSTWLDSYYSMGFCYEEIGEYKKAYDTWMKLTDILTQRGGVIEAQWPKEMAENCLKKLG